MLGRYLGTVALDRINSRCKGHGTGVSSVFMFCSQCACKKQMCAEESGGLRSER